MKNVILFQVAPDAAELFRASADDAATDRPLEISDEGALLAHIGSGAPAIDAVVLGEDADDAKRVAESVLGCDASVSVLWLRQDVIAAVPPLSARVQRLAANYSGQVLTALAASIAAARERRVGASIERSEGMRDALLSLVAHDIRAPLSVISGAMSELTHPTVGQLNDEQRLLIALMRRSIERLARLAQNLSYVARIDSGRLDLIRRETDLGVLAKATARKIAETEDLGTIQLDVQVPETPLLANVDPEKMAMAIGNIITNAVRFANNRICLRVVAAGETVRIEVDDDGHGIPEGDDVFERIRLSPKQSGQSGSGLGLAIVRGIAVAHGGSAIAENRKGSDGTTAGARFVVVVPASVP